MGVAVLIHCTLKGYNITNRDFMVVGLKKPGEKRRGKEAGERSGGGGFKSETRIAAYVAFRGEYYRLKLKGELIFEKEERLFRPPIPYSLLTHV